MTLDITTIFVLFILNSLIIAALLAVSFRGRRTAATDLWIASLLVQVVAFSFFVARGKAPDALTIVLANSLLSLSYAIFPHFLSWRLFGGIWIIWPTGTLLAD